MSEGERLGQSRGGVRDYDLAEVRAKARKMNQSIVWSFSIVGAMTLPMGAYLLYLIQTKVAKEGGWSSAIGISLLFAIAFLWLNSLWCFLFASKKLPGSDRLRISDDGVELLVGGTSTHSWMWNSPRDRFVLEDDSQSPGVGDQDLPSYYIKKSGFWSRSTALTREAFDAVLAAASGKGAFIVQRPSSPWIGSYPAILYEVSGGRRASSIARPPL
jgi:hypothetical protein